MGATIQDQYAGPTLTPRQRYRQRLYAAICRSIENYTGMPVNGQGHVIMSGIVAATEEMGTPPSDTPDLAVAAQVARQRYAAAVTRLRKLGPDLRQMQHERQAERDGAVSRIMDRDGSSRSAAEKVTHSDDRYADFLRRLDAMELDYQAAGQDADAARMDHDYAVAMLRRLPVEG